MNFKNLFGELNYNVEDLDNLSIADQVATPLNEYTPIKTMIDFIRENEGKDAVKVFLKDLRKKGYLKTESMDKYLANQALPSSGLKEVLKTPADFFFYLNDRKKIYEPEKKHFELGTFIHMAFLEPNLFKKVKTEPKASLSSKEGATKLCVFYKKVNKDQSEVDFSAMGLPDLKAYLEVQKAKCKYMMVQEDHKIIIDICRRNYERYGGGIIGKIMKGALIEKSFYSVDEETGLRVKVRPDAFNTVENIGVNAIISMKTTRQESVEGFMRDVAKFKYEVSEGMYQTVVSDVTGRKFDVTIMIMIQTVAPFLPAVIWWTPEDLQNGKYKYRYALNTAKECLDKKIFLGFESLAEEGNFGVISAELPKYSHKILSPVNLDY